jgi:hypothetical protein
VKYIPPSSTILGKMVKEREEKNTHKKYQYLSSKFFAEQGKEGSL